jgi:hypothetical protein
MKQSSNICALAKNIIQIPPQIIHNIFKPHGNIIKYSSYIIDAINETNIFIQKHLKYNSKTYDLVSSDIPDYLQIPDIQSFIKDIREYLEKNSGSYGNGGSYDNVHLNNIITDMLYKEELPQDIIAKYPNIYQNKLLVSHFVPKSIIDVIDKDINHVITITFDEDESKSINIYIDVNQIHNSRDENISNISNLILHRVILMLYLGTGEFNIADLPNKTSLYMTLVKKVIPIKPDNNFIFTPECVNSAVTDSENVIIYREEEALKSICHELIHYYELDFPYNELPDYILKYLLNSHQISPHNEYRLSEAVTEAMANFINIHCVSSNNSSSNSGSSGGINENILHKIHNRFADELSYSILNVSKIMRLLGYKSWNSFISSKESIKNTKKTNKLQQYNTSVFSYHIIKAYILWGFNKYLGVCIDKKSLKFSGNFKGFLQIIRNSHNNPIFARLVDEGISRINRGILKKNMISRKISRSQQMTKKIRKNLYNKADKIKKTDKGNLSVSDIVKTFRMTCL